ncbi:hypothetical protein SLEP1_g35269 [Rubroshorea leprosula]|uniref:Dirigent protein n=1 Tax=Rubroshorea leprosula TaxID=152421 RepID=A0AAV5KMR9_9ROSI|nr:hypothetical protein SLEP1_g35269 [Rubroshorea leprosula]
MANPKHSPSVLVLFLVLLLLSIAASVANSDVFSKSLSPSALELKHEKLTHLHFYFQDILSGKIPTAIRVAQAPTTNTSSTFFGAVNIIDDPLTVTPNINSTLVGRAQGLYALSSQEEASLMMVMTFSFLEGKYNGSTVSVLGRNPPFNKVREMPIVGGSGIFRFARGYAQARTNTFNLTTGDACIEYNVYVLHY